MTVAQGRRVLVTGACGFIGSHLVEALIARGDDVRALVHYDPRGGWGDLERVPDEIHDVVDVVGGDVRDAEQMRSLAAGCDVVFHLAALVGVPYSFAAPQSYLDTNVRGTMNVLEAARAAGAVLVHASTSETYGSAQAWPMTEDHPSQPQSPYAASKVAADAFVHAYARSFDAPVVTVRPFNTYGPRQSARAIIPTVMQQAHACGPVRLGALTPVRDLTYVTDTAAAFVAAAQTDAAFGQTIHVGAGEGVAIGDLARRILTVVGKPELAIEHDPARVRPAQSEVDRLICDATRARELLGWRPQIDLDTGLRQTWQAFLAAPPPPRPERYAQ